LAAGLGFSRYIFDTNFLTRWAGVASTRAIIAANGGRRPFMFVAHSFRTHSSRGPQIARSVAANDSAQT